MGIFDVKTAVVINNHQRDNAEYEEVNPEFCNACGHEIIRDDEESCPFCGEPLVKELRPKRKAGSGLPEYGGGIIFLAVVIFVVIWLFSAR